MRQKITLSLNILVILYLFCLFFSQAANSTIYSWTDKNGKKHFSDHPPPESAPGSGDSQVKELFKTKKYTVPIFTITQSVDPAIKGTYYPIYRSGEGLPQYQLKVTDDKPRKNKLPRIFAKKEKGKWEWQIKTDYSLYSSGLVREGLPPHKVRGWKMRYKSVPIGMRQEIIVASRDVFDHIYLYDMDRHSVGISEWQKQAFRVSGASEIDVNGDYYPVNWSSEYPRYRTGWDYCLEARQVGTFWQWSLGDCQLQSYSSSREAVDTTPDRVKQWFKNTGFHIVPLQVIRITK